MFDVSNDTSFSLTKQGKPLLTVSVRLLSTTRKFSFITTNSNHLCSTRSCLHILLIINVIQMKPTMTMPLCHITSQQHHKVCHSKMTLIYLSPCHAGVTRGHTSRARHILEWHNKILEPFPHCHTPDYGILEI